MSKYIGRGCAAGALVQVIIVILLLTGWVKSIVKFTRCDFEEPFKAEVVYGVGTFLMIPGAVIGWLDIEDGKKQEQK